MCVCDECNACDACSVCDGVSCHVMSCHVRRLHVNVPYFWISSGMKNPSYDKKNQACNVVCIRIEKYQKDV